MDAPPGSDNARHDPRLAAGRAAARKKPACVSDTQSDANCYPSDGASRDGAGGDRPPALAGVALGRTAPTQVLADTAPPARAGIALAKASDAEVATASTTVRKARRRAEESQEDGEPARPAPRSVLVWRPVLAGGRVPTRRTERSTRLTLYSPVRRGF